jgi:hypothetical protein
MFGDRRLERLSSLAMSRHDTDKHYGQTVKKATRNALMAQYHLPPSEQLLMSCDAKNVVEVKDTLIFLLDPWTPPLPWPLGQNCERARTAMRQPP